MYRAAQEARALNAAAYAEGNGAPTRVLLKLVRTLTNLQAAPAMMKAHVSEISRHCRTLLAPCEPVVLQAAAVTLFRALMDVDADAVYFCLVYGGKGEDSPRKSTPDGSEWARHDSHPRLLAPWRLDPLAQRFCLGDDVPLDPSDHLGSDLDGDLDKSDPTATSIPASASALSLALGWRQLAQLSTQFARSLPVHVAPVPVPLPFVHPRSSVSSAADGDNITLLLSALNQLHERPLHDPYRSMYLP